MMIPLVNNTKDFGNVYYVERNTASLELVTDDIRPDYIIEILREEEETEHYEGIASITTVFHNMDTHAQQRLFYHTARIIYKEMVQRRHTDQDVVLMTNDKQLAAPIIATALVWYREGEDLREHSFEAELNNLCDKLDMAAEENIGKLVDLGQIATMPGTNKLDNHRRATAFEAAISQRH